VTEAEAKIFVEAGLLTAEDAQALVAQGGIAADDGSPPVWLGKQDKVTTTGFREAPGLKVVSEDKVVSANKAATMFYGWSEDEVRKFQEKAFAAGLYGTYDRTKIPWGDHDEDTLTIWKKMVGRSAGFYEQGQKVTPWEALDKAAELAPPLDADGGATTSVANPLDLQRLLRETGREVLGSGNVPGASGLVSQYQSQQRVAGLEGVETAAPSAQTFFENALRNMDPKRYDARKVVSGLRSAFEFLGGSSGVGS
jgi:hypothetical protein